MAINCLTGLMGSGKSFESIVSIILPAMLKGRRIITNVDGINEEKIKEYLIKKNKLTDDQIEKLGSIVHIHDTDIKGNEEFFPNDDKERKSLVLYGDLVVVDEAWKFWGVGEKILPNHMEFFTKQRHYVHPETKISCDLVLMTQDIDQLNRQLKALIEFTTRTVKIKSLGMNKTYRCELYSTSKLTKKNQVGVQIRRYDKEIFPLYNSYIGGVGNEDQVDKRQNILNSKKLWFFLALIILVGIFGFTAIWKFFHPKDQVDNKTPADKAGAQVQQVNSVQKQNINQISNQNNPEFSKTWRITGIMEMGTKRFVVLANEQNSIRLENINGNCYNENRQLLCKFDNEKITYYTTFINYKGVNNEKNNNVNVVDVPR